MESNKKKIVHDENDKGHRYGNFHSYYNFHPPSDRIVPLFEKYFPNLMDIIIQHPNIDNSNPTLIANEKKGEGKRRVLTYCDLGCNEGDLTLAMANELHKRSSLNVRSFGIDIDAELIRRANEKSKILLKDDGVEASFKVGDLTNALDHLNVCENFFQSDAACTSDDEAEGERKQTQKDCRVCFDLCSIFSTTMWIHVHSGDEGLKLFLKRASAMCNVLLIEPQPSKWYGYFRYCLIRISFTHKRILWCEICVSFTAIEILILA